VPYELTYFPQVSPAVKVRVTAFGYSTDISTIIVTYTNGLLSLSGYDVTAVRIMGLTVSLAANANSLTSFTLQYLEPAGQTSLDLTQVAHVHQLNVAGAVQVWSAYTTSNNAGVVSVVKTGLVANAGNIFVAKF
jgi:hypothetical protein